VLKLVYAQATVNMDHNLKTSEIVTDEKLKVFLTFNVAKTLEDQVILMSCSEKDAERQSD
jgi:hypothetical protein